MAKLKKAIHEIHNLENLAERDLWLNRLHPLSKVFVTIWYLALVMSFDKMDITGLLLMSLYPVVIMILGDISIRQAFKRLAPVFLMIGLIGAANPVFDRRPCFLIGEMTVTAGMVSMTTLFLKTVFAAAASYILIASTTMEQVCYALRKLRLPRILVTVFLLIYRYLVLMLKEADRITQAYSLRAPKERGIGKRAWGSLAGQMLLRSMDRAQTVYDAMMLRGFCGEFFLSSEEYPASARQSICYGAFWGMALAVLRFVPVLEFAENLF